MGPYVFGVREHVELPRARPGLHRPLARDCRFLLVIALVVDGTLHAMRIREAIGQALTMLVDSPQQVVRHADIERAMRPAGEDIDVIRHGLEWAAQGIARSSPNNLTRPCRALSRRSGARRGGQECVRKCQAWGCLEPIKKK